VLGLCQGETQLVPFEHLGNTVGTYLSAAANNQVDAFVAPTLDDVKAAWRETNTTASLPDAIQVLVYAAKFVASEQDIQRQLDLLDDLESNAFLDTAKTSSSAASS
jgi:hypothetical protein